ncbi:MULTISPECIES: MarR family winged helix-turn-helix transcriptional regulator [Chryseobacterium]|uniref:MarR family transcriptional regulator n=1 Tax=Chryseobacterium cucumeris TaxID=1813611 RepID=A0ABX9X2K6_9FLAO|nr:MULTISPECIES: MarR family transcriptional regulator [Chryseobacterium]MDH5032645.1 MarR family transcriptional regulator [Chryseobacterium cucumeris]QWT86286.1 winged helix DNA-binding protein [Chryseobacterium sp. PCH239]ROH86074.1 MarR family transcriptional regulator [Chryseobacterium cucumeris]WFB69143.1 MarR family transcriptional regulator [Chryseobacterium sp. WX]
MQTDFFIDLLHHVKEFEHSDACKSNSTVDDFRVWMNDKKYADESPTKLFKNENHQVSFTENEICKQVLLLGRYSKLLIRKGLGDFPELANEEFTYLYRLKDEPFLTKIQLIEKNGHEKQTGTQIIKRLLEAGFLEEKNDKDDKRSKRLNLTKKGEEIFHASVSNVNLISKILSGKLDKVEKNEFLRILKKLNEFHYHIYVDYKNSDINQISEFFL